MKKQSLLLMLASVAALCAGCQQGGFNSTTGSNETSTGSPTTVSPTTETPTTVAPTTATPTTPTPTTATPTTAAPTTATPTTPVPVPEITVDEFESVITTAISKSDSIASGTIKYKVVGGYSPADLTLTYEIGEDSFHYQKGDWSGNEVVDYYVIKDGNDKVLIQKDSDEYIKPYETFNNDTFDYPYGDVLGSYSTYYGAGNFVSSLFESGKSNVNDDFKISFKDDVYSFSFGYWEIGWGTTPTQYFEAEVSFKLGTEKELNDININVNTYRLGSFIFDDELNVVYLSDDAEANETTSYSITQTVGTKNYICPVKLSDFYATSFDLYYDGEKVTSETTISIANGEEVSLTLEDILPSTTNFDFDELEFVVDEGDEEGISGYYDFYYEKFNISGLEIGSYTVSLKTKNVTKTFKVEVTKVVPTSVSFYYSIVKPDGEYDSITTNDTTINGYVDCEYILVANILPYTAEQDVTYKLISDNASTGTLEMKEIALSKWADLEEYCCFSASAVGTYVIRISSKDYPAIYKDITFNIGNKPSFSSVLSSDEFAYVDYGGISYLFDFTPSASDDNSGTVVITDYASSDTETASYSISKAENGYKVTLTHISGEEFNFTLAMTDSFDLYVYFEYEGGEGGSYEKLSVVSPELYLCGNWSGEIEDKELNLEMFIYNDRSLSISLYNSDYSVYQSGFGSITLTESDNGYTGSIVAVEVYDNCTIVFPITITVDKDFTSISVKLVVGEETYNFTLSIYVYEY